MVKFNTLPISVCLCLLVIKEVLVVRHKQLYLGIYSFIAGGEGILFAVGASSKDSWNLFQ